MSYQYHPSLLDEVDVPKGGITSRPIYSDESTRVVLFAFDAGQELSEHTASMPATLQLLRGEATLTLGKETFEAGPGSFATMAANLPHSIVAKTPLVMLLTLLKSAKP